MLILKKSILILLATILVIMIEGMFSVALAEMITLNFQWTGETGYTAKGVFSYDDQVSPKIMMEKGAGETKSLRFLSVSFYSSSGNLIKTYNNVVNGIAKGQYFQFNFDTKKQTISGIIDVGGESSGEVYLKGKVTQNLSLFQVREFNSDTIIDRDFGVVTASR